MNSSADVFWCKEHLDGELSIAEFLQFHSGKSKKVMEVSGLKFYPLHINVMKIFELMQHLMNSHGHTLLTFLPVQFGHEHEGTDAEENSLKRLYKLKSVHHCIAQPMKPQDDAALRRIQTRPIDHERLSFRIVIGSYSADIPEQKDACVKYSNRINQPRPRCQHLKEEMKNCTNCAARTIEQTKNSLSDYEAMITIAEGICYSRTTNTRFMKEEAEKNWKACLFTLPFM